MAQGLRILLYLEHVPSLFLDCVFIDDAIEKWEKDVTPWRIDSLSMTSLRFAKKFSFVKW
jgi:hypothetical protein